MIRIKNTQIVKFVYFLTDQLYTFM